MKKFDKLHKNLGKNEKSFTVWRLFFMLNIAEDKLWSTQNKNNTDRDTFYFAVKKIESITEQDGKTSALAIIFFKYHFWLAWLDA